MLKFDWEADFKQTEIGNVPREWEVKKLRDSNYTIIMGQSPPSKFYNTEGRGVPFIQGRKNFGELYIHPTTFTEKCNKMAPAESVLITVRAPVGDLNITKNDVCIGRGLAAIYTNNITLNRFIYYTLMSLKEYIVSLGERGTTYEEITKGELENIIFPHPPLLEQSRIAAVLSWFDELIENKKRQNEILGKAAMAIFKSWFVDFEPFRDEEFVYNEKLGREIPKGWKVGPTVELIQYNPPIKMDKGKNYKFVEMKMVKTNSLACDFEERIFKGNGVKYRGGDTLLARITPSLEHGKTAYVWFISEEEMGFGSTEFFVLHPRKAYLKEFIYLLAKDEDFREIAINSMSGTSGRQRADIDALKNYIIPIPPQPILQKFHEIVEPMFKKIINNQKETMILKKARDALLPLLVFGKLRVEKV